MSDLFATNDRIRELRDHLGLGRAAFEEATGIPRKTIANIEQRIQKAYAWHIEAICKKWPEYAYWLATGNTLPDAGQISPDIEKQRRA